MSAASNILVSAMRSDSDRRPWLEKWPEIHARLSVEANTPAAVAASEARVRRALALKAERQVHIRASMSASAVLAPAKPSGIAAMVALVSEPGLLGRPAQPDAATASLWAKVIAATNQKTG